ncbi:MAG: ADP-ribose pyrophosphatase, partial [Leuconostoc gelidum]
EMGIRVQGTKLLSVTENLFSFEGKLNNEVCFTWLVVKIDNQTVYAKDDWEQTLVWRSLNSISNLKPHALQAVLNNLPTQVVHLINIDKGE